MKQLHIEGSEDPAPSGAAEDSLPFASDATIAAIKALMMRRTKINSARQAENAMPVSPKQRHDKL